MKKINIGIIGLGNIGSALIDVLRKNQAEITKQSGVEIKVKKVCDIKKRPTPYYYSKDAFELINDPSIDLIVEVIGGVQPALKFILAALRAKKHVVTSNKEVIAKHLKEILAMARKNKVQVMFEAAVGGGIPIIQPLREELSGSGLTAVFGIVNGTTNYILTKMSREGMEFSQALKQAQAKGYAEPDPTNDIKGYDAAYKAAILAAVAFGIEVDWRAVHCEGITKISQEDIQYAAKIGYVIKLLAVARIIDHKLDVRVHPALVRNSHPLAGVSNNLNAIYVKGGAVGELMFEGQGAGGGPTASALISDIVVLGRGKKLNQIQQKKIKIINPGEICDRYYLRLNVADRPGVLAKISKAFAGKKVSISTVVQLETDGKDATLVITVHETPGKNLLSALNIIKKLAVVKKVCNVIRIVS
ncbi:MAG: homoserine dehydrogenase [bacterium]